MGYRIRAGKSELIVPVTFKESTAKVVVEYVW